MKKFIYLLCFSIVLTACSAKQDNTEKLYSSVVEKYLKYTNDKELRNLDETNSMAFLYWDDYYDGLFSTQYDVDGDGTPELLISVRDLQGRYALLGIYTNKDDSLVRLTNKENGLDAIGERMDIQILKDGTLFYKGSAGLSGTSLIIYELNDEKTNYIKQKDIQMSDVDELSESMIDLSKLEWKNIGVTKEIPLIKYMISGDYSRLNGKWKNGQGQIITINEKKVIFSEESTGIMNNPELNGDAGLIQIGITFDNGTGAGMCYIPKEYDGDIPVVEGQTQANTERITISQAKIGPEEVFYRFEE